MVTFLAGGTGTPKLLAGLDAVCDPASTTVVANTGDDVELGGHLVCPDVDTTLFLRGDVLDTDTWWGIEDDTARTHEELQRIAEAAGRSTEPHYLPADRQTAGPNIANWRRFSGVGEFMHIGDRDRAVHVTRTSLLEEGNTLTEATAFLADAFDLEVELLPMSDDPVATLVESDDGWMHFQEFWVARDGDPTVDSVEFRGEDAATATPAVREALTDPVVIGPSNPITSIGPMLALDGVEAALRDTPAVAVSPFVGDRVFSGPAGKLMAAAGYEASTAGVAEAYPFVDGFVLDDADETELDRPTVSTDTTLDTDADAERVLRATLELLDAVTEREVTAG
jgi:LPPG:FO 2-phospho-L-lactate transferase